MPSARKPKERPVPAPEKKGKNFRFVAAMAKKGRKAYDGVDGGGIGSSTSSYNKPRRHMELLMGDSRRRSHASDSVSTTGRSRGDEMPSTTPVGSYINGVLGGKLHPGLVHDDHSDEQETNDSEPEPEVEVLDEDASADTAVVAEDAKTFVQATADKIVELRTENLQLQERLLAAERQLKAAGDPEGAEGQQAKKAGKEEGAKPRRQAAIPETSPEVPLLYQISHQQRPVAATSAELALLQASRAPSPSPSPSRSPSPSPAASPMPMLLSSSTPTLDGELTVTERRVQKLEASALQLKRRLAGANKRAGAPPAPSAAKPPPPPPQRQPQPQPSRQDTEAAQLKQSAAALRQQLEKAAVAAAAGREGIDPEKYWPVMRQLADRADHQLRPRLEDSSPADREELRQLAEAGANLRDCLARIERGLRAELTTARAAAAEAANRAASRSAAFLTSFSAPDASWTKPPPRLPEPAPTRPSERRPVRDWRSCWLLWAPRTATFSAAWCSWRILCSATLWLALMQPGSCASWRAACALTTRSPVPPQLPTLTLTHHAVASCTACRLSCRTARPAADGRCAICSAPDGSSGWP
ncbi:hypothetical protein BOX15_Mlig009751g2 [Macrostomum lignano]|uniref:Uncharacterized protein n=1 Tax=Macrostomum lignano TaxID=282301 RepID=A0A267DDZ0_9PLAT|nr:hypothetical protein BOX15_Mlig021260g1 [Macrostomum lignano]PAA52490.1 hypothetical protein BOX15_Mlig009751g2 [Macrostomum lignano]